MKELRTRYVWSCKQCPHVAVWDIPPEGTDGTVKRRCVPGRHYSEHEFKRPVKRWVVIEE